VCADIRIVGSVTHPEVSQLNANVKEEGILTENCT
jgi:hypothetical protein